MNNYVVTILDTTGIQSYIFTSNRLRENIGASYLVKEATNNWVKDHLEKLGVPKHRQSDPITSSGLIAELVYAGGGNAILLFKSLENARQFTHHLSKQILEQAPGINLVATHKEFDWGESLYRVVQGLIDNELEKEKRARIPSVPLLGLGITASCNSTQLVAVDTSADYVKVDEEDTYLISLETQAKLKAVSVKHGEPANRVLKEDLGDILRPKNLHFPYRIDDLGRSRNESSYYAVIHADGNSMGKRFEACGEEGKKLNPQDPNRGYIDYMRNLSKSVRLAGISALKTVVEVLVDSIEDEKVIGKFSIKDNYLPFRPLVYGGDDVTFICDGRLGLELAAIYLEKLQNLKVTDAKPLTACAGVCIVKSHYPFARAYEMSEALCRNAKKFARQQEDKEFSAIDWHIASSGLSGSVDDIRQREYKVAEGNLTMRPIIMENKVSQWRTWANFRNLVEKFNEDENWKNRRNKVIALREKLREGQEATRQFLKAYKIDSLPPVKGVSDEIQTSGWASDIDSELRSGYFDAIEAMEFYFPLT